MSAHKQFMTERKANNLKKVEPFVPITVPKHEPRKIKV